MNERSRLPIRILTRLAVTGGGGCLTGLPRSGGVHGGPGGTRRRWREPARRVGPSAMTRQSSPASIAPRFRPHLRLLVEGNLLAGTILDLYRLSSSDNLER